MGEGYLSSYHLYGVEIGLYELWGYAKAEKNYKRLLANQDQFIESLYDEIAPSIVGVDYDEGRMFALKADAERTALKIIEEKDLYQRKMKKEKQKAELFKAAMASLPDKEQRLIGYKYIANSKMTYKEMSSAEQKMIDYLTKEKQKDNDEIVKAERAALRDQIHAKPKASKREVLRIF